MSFKNHFTNNHTKNLPCRFSSFHIGIEVIKLLKLQTDFETSLKVIGK